MYFLQCSILIYLTDSFANSTEFRKHSLKYSTFKPINFYEKQTLLGCLFLQNYKYCTWLRESTGLKMTDFKNFPAEMALAKDLFD